MSFFYQFLIVFAISSFRNRNIKSIKHVLLLCSLKFLDLPPSQWSSRKKRITREKRKAVRKMKWLAKLIGLENKFFFRSLHNWLKFFLRQRSLLLNLRFHEKQDQASLPQDREWFGSKWSIPITCPSQFSKSSKYHC